MIDFWEMMGLLVVDSDFREDLLAARPDGYEVPDNLRVSIPTEHYTMLRRIVRPYMPNKPISLMALGEMLFALTFQDFCDKACAVAEGIAELNIDPDDESSFCIALGAMIVDPNLVTALIKNNAWRKMGFGFVSRADRRALNSIVNAGINPVLANKIDDFCYDLWGSDCNDQSVEWDGHTHPVAPLPTGLRR